MLGLSCFNADKGIQYIFRPPSETVHQTTGLDTSGLRQRQCSWLRLTSSLDTALIRPTSAKPRAEWKIKLCHLFQISKIYNNHYNIPSCYLCSVRWSLLLPALSLSLLSSSSYVWPFLFFLRLTLCLSVAAFSAWTGMILRFHAHILYI